MDQESLQAFIEFVTSPEKRAIFIIWGAAALSAFTGIRFLLKGNHVFAWPTFASSAAMASIMMDRQEVMEWAMPICMTGFVIAIIRSARQPKRIK